MRTFLSGRKGRRDVPGSDQERVLITFHHKEERRRRRGRMEGIMASRNSGSFIAINPITFPLDPGIEDYAELSIADSAFIAIQC